LSQELTLRFLEMALTPKVQFHSLVDTGFLRGRRELKSFVEKIFKLEARALRSIQFIFCSDKYLLQINRQFLSRDYLTDVISFDLSSDKFVEGEVYISVDRIRKNAKIFKRPISEEIHRVIFHGTLHLCGYTDSTEVTKAQMSKLEDRYLNAYSGI
jgi:probable rRNA maturation factor